MTSTSGTTHDCLAVFLRRRDYERIRQILSKFARVRVESVDRWRRQGSNPKGEELIRVRVLLDLLGYEVTEFEDVSVPARQLARAVAYDVYSIRDIQQSLGYANRKDVFAIMLQGSSMITGRVRQLEELATLAGDDIDKQSARWRRIIDGTEEFDSKTNNVTPQQNSRPHEAASADADDQDDKGDERPNDEETAIQPPTEPEPTPNVEPPDADEPAGEQSDDTPPQGDDVSTDDVPSEPTHGPMNKAAGTVEPEKSPEAIPSTEPDRPVSTSRRRRRRGHDRGRRSDAPRSYAEADTATAVPVPEPTDNVTVDATVPTDDVGATPRHSQADPDIIADALMKLIWELGKDVEGDTNALSDTTIRKLRMTFAPVGLHAVKLLVGRVLGSD